MPSPTKVKTACPMCSSILEVMSTDITLYVEPTAVDLVGEESYYSFYCPGCDNIATREANQSVARLLTQVGDVDVLFPSDWIGAPST